MDYKAELTFATDLALEAGGLMRRYFRSEELATEWKADDSPLTLADTTVNKLVIDQVRAAFPDHGVLGEEESYKPERETIWVVDPLDGTMPFSLGIPISTFSIALVNRRDGQPVVAVTYDPYLEELYTAIKGGGAFLNDKPIKTSSTATDFKQNYFFMGGIDVNRPGVEYNAARTMVEVRAKGGKVISIPSGTYFTNRIAAGQFAGAIIGVPKSWDVAASALLVEEAGGIVTDLQGKKRRYDENGLGCVLASNETIFAQLMELVRADYENSRH